MCVYIYIYICMYAQVETLTRRVKSFVGMGPAEFVGRWNLEEKKVALVCLLEDDELIHK